MRIEVAIIIIGGRPCCRGIFKFEISFPDFSDEQYCPIGIVISTTIALNSNKLGDRKTQGDGYNGLAVKEFM